MIAVIRLVILWSRRETSARAWLSIFGARLTSRLNLRRVFQFPPAMIQRRFPKPARSDFRRKEVLPAGLREPGFLSPEFRCDRKSPVLATANATTEARS